LTTLNPSIKFAHSVFLVTEIYVLFVTETIVLLVTKNSALLFTDYNPFIWLPRGPYRMSKCYLEASFIVD
jgi:hypothetical protein